MSISAESEKVNNGSIATGLPKAGVLMKPREEVENDGPEAEHNTIFDSLVKVEGEVAGLVAYSIYKQNKRAWLNDFIKATGSCEVKLELKDAQSAGQLRPSEGEDYKYRYIVMPMRI